MSNSANVNEQSGSPRESRNPGLTSDFNVGSQVEVGTVKPVSSTPADNTVFPEQPAPRGETEQAGS